MLAEADFVGIFGVCVVRVDGLRAVRVLGRLGHLGTLLSASTAGVSSTGCWAGTSKARRLGRVALGARSTAGVAGYGGGGLETAQLGGGVHLGGVASGHGLGASTEGAGHGAATAVGTGLLLVEGKGVDESAV